MGFGVQSSGVLTHTAHTPQTHTWHTHTNTPHTHTTTHTAHTAHTAHTDTHRHHTTTHHTTRPGPSGLGLTRSGTGPSRSQPFPTVLAEGTANRVASQCLVGQVDQESDVGQVEPHVEFDETESVERLELRIGPIAPVGVFQVREVLHVNAYDFSELTFFSAFGDAPHEGLLKPLKAGHKPVFV